MKASDRDTGNLRVCIALKRICVISNFRPHDKVFWAMYCYVCVVVNCSLQLVKRNGISFGNLELQALLSLSEVKQSSRTYHCIFCYSFYFVVVLLCIISENLILWYFNLPVVMKMFIYWGIPHNFLYIIKYSD